jgi:hypothetical protein
MVRRQRRLSSALTSALVEPLWPQSQRRSYGGRIVANSSRMWCLGAVLPSRRAWQQLGQRQKGRKAPTLSAPQATECRKRSVGVGCWKMERVKRLEEKESEVKNIYPRNRPAFVHAPCLMRRDSWWGGTRFADAHSPFYSALPKFSGSSLVMWPWLWWGAGGSSKASLYTISPRPTLLTIFFWFIA